MRQSAFALVGDLAKVAASLFTPSIGDLLALGIANLQPAMLRQESMSACNNACWSLGGNIMLSLSAHLKLSLSAHMSKVHSSPSCARHVYGTSCRTSKGCDITWGDNTGLVVCVQAR